MSTNLFLYLTAMSAVSINNLVNNINEVTRSFDPIKLRTIDTNWTLDNDLITLDQHCNGTRQSPINIITSEVKDDLTLRLGLTAYDKPISGAIINRFPTFQIIPLSLKWPRPSVQISKPVARSFNPFADKHYTLSHIQFYWSHKNLGVNNSDRSSVHLIDGEDFPLEIHFLHLNTAYSNIDEALAKSDGLMILAVMAVPSSHENYLFDRILDHLGNITVHGKQSFIDEESTWRTLLPSDTSRFYRYPGSLIFPPCYESVDWILFDEKLKLGRRQLKRLRQIKFVSTDLRTDKEIDWSKQRRPIQSRFDRPIERSFNFEDKDIRRYSRRRTVAE